MTAALAGIAIASAGCSVDVRRDTPEATVTSLIKLYESSDGESRLDEVVAPIAARMSARNDACLTVRLKRNHCMEATLKSFQAGPYGTVPAECESPAKPVACTCGSVGARASSKASSFAPMFENAGLKAAHLSIASCEVRSSEKLSTKGSEERLGYDFWDNACEDVDKQDTLSAVQVSCKGLSESLTFILRQNPRARSWSVIGFSPNTEATLLHLSDAASARTP